MNAYGYDADDDADDDGDSLNENRHNYFRGDGTGCARSSWNPINE